MAMFADASGTFGVTVILREEFQVMQPEACLRNLHFYSYRSDGVVDNTLDYQSRDGKINFPRLRSFG